LAAFQGPGTDYIVSIRNDIERLLADGVKQ
jgi:hypothetical protein